jgi:pimeloyl-ACP methyl ester carboxylesterase
MSASMERAFPASRRVRTNGVELAVHECGRGFPVLLVHGFPDLAYSFRHQLPALDAAGFRAIAPDLRGVGASERPAEIEAYDVEALTRDLVGVFDALGIERAAIVGHDHGATLAFELARRHPARVAGVAALVMPFSAAPPVPPTALYRAAFDPSFFLLAYQAPGHAEAALEADVDRTLRYFYRSARGVRPGEHRPFEVEGFALLDELRAPEPEWARPSLLAPAEHAYYREAFAKTGFAGALAPYRNLDRNWSLSRRLPETITAPVLMITAEHEVIVPAERSEGMEALCPDLTRVHVADAGHFVHQEQPERVDRALIDWLRARVAPLTGEAP